MTSIASKTQLTIEQTLHGYSQGHRLLAASCSLSATAQRVLLELSDLSGDLTTGFEEYLTGYPVPDTNYYAFAKTWYAPEMERPGCVWTHTLLIRDVDFEFITNPHPLAGLFKKPKKGTRPTNYEASISHELTNSSNKDFIIPGSETDTSISDLYAFLFYDLYETSKKVVILAADSQLYESLVLSSWSQQWPALRSRFTFSTGSLEGRTISKKSFDLQIAPKRNKSFFLRYEELTLLDPTAINIGNNSTQPAPYRSFFRKYDSRKRFIWYYGARMEPLRENFGWLAKLFDLVEQARYQPDAIPDVTDYLASRFAKPSEVRELKASLYGRSKSVDPVTPALADDRVLLRALFDTPWGEIFNATDLEIGARTSELWQTTPKTILEIAATYKEKMPMNSIRHEFLSTVARCVSPAEAYKLGKRKRSLMLALWNLNPRLIGAEELWRREEKASEYAMRFLSDFSHSTASSVLDWQEVINAMLRAGNDSYVQQLHQLVGDAKLVDLILDGHARSCNAITINQGWYNYLRENSDRAFAWASQKKHSIITKGLVATLQSPHSENVISHGSAPWVELAQNANAAIPQPYLTDIMAFLLALGLQNIDDGSQLLVIASFQVVYDAAGSNFISNLSWSHLDQLAPSRHILFEWDKCRRLEEALISRTLKFGWTPSVIVLAAKSSGTLWRLLNRAHDSYGGKTALKKIEGDFRSGNLVVDPALTEALETFFAT